jgi:predicted PurR-regulated permease PerM
LEKSERVNLRIFLLLFLLIILQNIFLFKGMFHSLAFAAIIAGTFYPFHIYLQNRFKCKPEITAIITTFTVTFLILIPMAFLLFQVSKEGVGLFTNVKSNLSVTQVKDFFLKDGFLAELINKFSDSFGLDIDLVKLYEGLLTKIQGYAGKVFGTLNKVVSDVFNFIFQFLIMIVALFSLFLDGPKMKEFFFKLSPLPDDQEQMILEKFSQMNYVTLICNGLGGVIQGVLAGIGFWVAGIHSVFLWSTVMIVLAFIPLVGISIITIPASIYLFAIGQKTTAITLLIYTSVIALIIENWFKPRFMGPRVKVNSMLLLFYIVAGMQTFGMAGIFYGPLLCTIFLAMVELFNEYYLPRLYR